MHILGYRFNNGSRVRFERQFSDTEFAEISMFGLPEGWIHWRLRDDRVFATLAWIPVPYNNKGEPVDPLDLLEMQLPPIRPKLK